MIVPPGDDAGSTYRRKASLGPDMWDGQVSGKPAYLQGAMK
jgi:hypothetical protein